MQENKQIEIYHTEGGHTQVEVRFSRETVWLSQAQLVDLFDRDQSVISRHIRNAFKDKEVDEKSNMQKMHIANSDKPVSYYDLEVIISIGYRIKSKQGVWFRRWATQRLKEFLIKGYSLDKKRFEQNSIELQQALRFIEKTSKSSQLTLEAGRGLTEIVTRYTQTFLWLQQYDEGLLEEPEGTPGGKLIDGQTAQELLNKLKQTLMSKGEATNLFANPRAEGLAGIFGNLEQTVFGKPAYPTIEIKAAHLLYFIVKNHPFSDGNKRSGAFLFIDFLNRNNRLLNTSGDPIINDTGLAALTLLVAESDPKQKNMLIKLIMHMLTSN